MTTTRTLERQPGDDPIIHWYGTRAADGTRAEGYGIIATCLRPWLPENHSDQLWWTPLPGLTPEGVRSSEEIEASDPTFPTMAAAVAHAMDYLDTAYPAR
jgi:hypothetical protein